VFPPPSLSRIQKRTSQLRPSILNPTPSNPIQRPVCLPVEPVQLIRACLTLLPRFLDQIVLGLFEGCGGFDSVLSLANNILFGGLWERGWGWGLGSEKGGKGERVGEKGEILFRDSDKSRHGVAGQTCLLEARVEVFHKQRFGGVEC
jgi:hypothetical protein